MRDEGGTAGRALRAWATLLTLLVGMAAAGGAVAEERLWVSSSNAKIVAEPSATAKTVVAVPVGTELSVLDSKDRWYRVSTAAGQEGWIYRGKVATSPSAGESGGLFGSMGSSGIQVSAADTSRSIRGLSPVAEQYADAARTPAEYRKAVDAVMAQKTTDAEVERFLRDGKIGEYAE